MTVTAIWTQSAGNQLDVKGAAEQEKKKKKKKKKKKEEEQEERDNTTMCENTDITHNALVSLCLIWSAGPKVRKQAGHCAEFL